jgi:hypothetical protein
MDVQYLPCRVLDARHRADTIKIRSTKHHLALNIYEPSSVVPEDLGQ